MNLSAPAWAVLAACLALAACSSTGSSAPAKTAGAAVAAGSTAATVPAGASAASAPAAAAAAAPAATAPTPAAASAPPAPPKRCDYVARMPADSAFAAGKAELTPAGRAALDQDVVGKLAGCGKVELVIVAVHTDRLADARAAQSLTEKRAEAIGAYLAARGLTAPVETMGMGKTVPAKSCADPAATGDIRTQAQLVDCLAPNRRVQVDVRGLAK